MKITSVDTFVVDFYRTNLVIVRVSTDDGIVGLGEATLEGKERAVQGAIAEVAEAVIGLDPTRISGTMYELARDWYWRGGPVIMTALSSLETALWDISARELGVPVSRLFGGATRDRVRAYANGWFSGAVTPDDYAAAALRTVETGFRGLKWDPFENYDLTITSQQLDRALAQIDAVRSAVGRHVEIFIEGHGRFDVRHAIKIAQEIAQFEPVWFEEPCPPDSLDALADVRRASPVPIAAGERWFGRQGFVPALSRQAVDFVQPDVTHAGGLSELAFISTLAAAGYVGFAPHNPSGPLSTAATLQLGATLPNFRYLEIMATDVPWRPRVTNERLTLTEDGDVLVPTGIGLGIELDLEEIAKHPFTPRPMRLFEDAVYDIRPPDERSFFNLGVDA
ncbi:mandelate racemase/muconate lactonizing enzyme family protein [Phytoactinopolyspora halotolerans]|uniref:Mandelate racemase/muconate lactonizing enzyme family protein n=1 Tax=Phytoactinopolyspora halotolerans TaxID=1981512 RepID=A0A6L9SBK5_9ACTN|nr:mandelate racemase/muconate lactonizing enzyme family protein [Phytoactinopolyspora halotolerans]NEE01888.1 mandelate racemase/muconate lactonizing enzyme family protein [Phytoactinopolyspora halotolerans]